MKAGKHQSWNWCNAVVDVASSLTMPDPMICVHKLRLNKVMGCFYYKISTKLSYSIAIVHSRSRNKHLTCRTLWPVEPGSVDSCLSSMEHLYSYLTACLTVTLTSSITQSNECDYFLNLTCVHCAVQNKTLMT